jgi:hypothetical protein
MTVTVAEEKLCTSSAAFGHSNPRIRDHSRRGQKLVETDTAAVMKQLT